MTFEELIHKDIAKTFLNFSEFGEEHIINEKKMIVIIDDNELTERKMRINQHTDGVYMNQKLIYAAASDFKTRPTRDSILWLDNESYRVSNVISEDGIYSITIEGNRGR